MGQLVCLCIPSLTSGGENSMRMTADVFEGTGYSHFLAQTAASRGRAGLSALIHPGRFLMQF